MTAASRPRGSAASRGSILRASVWGAITVAGMLGCAVWRYEPALPPLQPARTPCSLRAFLAFGTPAYPRAPGSACYEAFVEGCEYVESTWHQWRGPLNSGATTSDPPLKFSATKNIKWRIPIPGKGHSTPVFADGKVLLTAATRAASSQTEAGTPYDFLVLAFDAETGREAWRTTAISARPPAGDGSKDGWIALTPPLTDGEIVIADFGARGVYAYDLDGGLLWEKDLGRRGLRNAFGKGIAPVLFDNSLILHYDHEGVSRLLVLDKRTGEQLWRTEPDEGRSWAQPAAVIVNGHEQVVTSSTKVRSYDLETGSLIWEASGSGPSPEIASALRGGREDRGKVGLTAIPAIVYVRDKVVFATNEMIHCSGSAVRDRMVLAMTEHPKRNLLAIRLGGTGDLTGNPKYLRWTSQLDHSYTTSPALHEGILYLLTAQGWVSAFDAGSGKKHYQRRLPAAYSFQASPVAAYGKLYLASEQGEVIVLKLGKKYEVLAVNDMGDEVFVASPIIANRRMYLRSEDELFCIAAN